MTTSDELYARASRVLPGGATAAARVRQATGRPLYMARGEGSRLFDVDGREYIDMSMSMGASLLGHGHRAVRGALAKAARLGIMCAMESEYHTALAEKICSAIPCAEMVRFTLSGTETTWYAVRLARAVTGRTKVVKFEGHFHGYNDYLQYNFWPPLDEAWPKLHREAPGAPGMDEQIIVLPFNDPALLEQALAEHKDEIACVILEPVNYNSGGILPLPGYLERLRELTQRYGIVLIFDEILSGFRTGASCMQGYLGVTPDLCTLGKALGGGVPLSAFAGKREIMSQVAPLGKTMHSGTYNANLVNILPGLAFMDEISKSTFYPRLLARCERLYAGMDAAFQRAGLQARAQGLGARFGVCFGAGAEGPFNSGRDAARQDWKMGTRFYQAATERGLFFQGMRHHGISGAHSDADIEQVIAVVEQAAQVAAQGE
jgi:glutamate-1-semialdehyde 2,1-aminomutase